MARFGLFVLAISFFVSGFACDGNKGPACIYDTECPAAQICRNGECVDAGCAGGCNPGNWCSGIDCLPCADDQHCGTACLDCSALGTNRACVQGGCGCNAQTDCASDETCLSHNCVTKDCPNRNCPGEDDVCYLGECVSVDCIGVECPSEQSCASGFCYPDDCQAVQCPGYGEVCIDGECIQNSCVEIECPPGQSCSNGFCYPDDCQQACAADEICEAGICVDAACAGVDCHEDYRCQGGDCVACTSHDACGMGCVDCTSQANNQACVDGDCACLADGDCAAGEQCLSSTCTGCESDCADKCGGADDGCGGSCMSSCPGGQWCQSGRCADCQDDAHCGGNCANCTDASVAGDHCDLSSDPGQCACAGDSGCPGASYCSNPPHGQCVQCASDEHCGPSCTDCTAQSNNQACLDGACGCQDDGDCASGEVCQSGTCSGCNPDCHGKCGGASDDCGGTCDDVCPSGNYCQDQACAVCADDQHCGSSCLDCAAQSTNQRCLSGACGCGDGADCAFAQWCDGGSCQDCQSDAHCGMDSEIGLCLDCASQHNDQVCRYSVPLEAWICGCSLDSHCASGYECQSSRCVEVCNPDCSGKCGGASDGCGGTCNSCLAGQYCNNTTCQDCDVDSACGMDSEHGLCLNCAGQSNDQICRYSVPLEAWICGCTQDGHCDSGYECQNNRCVGVCNPDCHGKCGGASDGCGGSCDDACPSGQYCSATSCQDCDVDAACGMDSEHGLCVNCTSQQNDQICRYSVPLEAWVCGCTQNSHCGSGYECQNNSCQQICVPNCSGMCGGASDGCGGTCNSCPSGQNCNGTTCANCTTDAACGSSCQDCTNPNENGDHCWDDGSGGYFCACWDSYGCLPGYYCAGGAPAGVCTACTSDSHCGMDSDFGLCVNCAGQSNNQICRYSVPLEAYVCGCTSNSHCDSGYECQNNFCMQTCIPDCAGKCGGVSDGCGGTCNSCPSGQNCNGTTCANCTTDAACGSACQDCTNPNENGDHCWDDGSGGYFCACWDSYGCLPGYYCAGGAPAGVCTLNPK